MIVRDLHRPGPSILRIPETAGGGLRHCPEPVVRKSTAALFDTGNALVRKDGEYPLFDGLGSEGRVTSSSQTVTGTATYEGFGQTVATTGSSSDPYMFAATSGYRNDGDAGLMLVGARRYDAQAAGAVTTWFANGTSRVVPNRRQKIEQLPQGSSRRDS